MRKGTSAYYTPTSFRKTMSYSLFEPAKGFLCLKMCQRTKTTGEKNNSLGTKQDYETSQTR